MEGKAYCHGAATIINGIVLGKGAAYGISLTTRAKVKLTGEAGIFEVEIENDTGENTALAKYCVLEVLNKFGLASEHGAKIITSSDIPISRGLKSSSAAANAIILATFKALGEDHNGLEVIDLGVNAALEAKVTITGAFDDACATYFGNVVVTDNRKRKILAQYSIEEDYEVIIYVPKRKIKKMDIDLEKLKGIKDAVEKAYNFALNKNYQMGILINGMAHGIAWGLDIETTAKALKAGAFTAGISGTGPATVILAEPEKKEDIISALGSDEQIICTTLNRERADTE